jgi:uncharacterized protein (TIGR02246 family)
MRKVSNSIVEVLAMPAGLKYRILSTALTTLVVGATSCAPHASRQAPLLGSAVDAIFAQYAASLRAGDAAAWAALWTEDGVQMPPDAPAITGRSQIRESIRRLLADFRFDMQIRTDEVRSAGDWGFARGTYSATLTSKEGGATIPIDGKFMTILARQADGSWKIHRDIFNSNVPTRAP